ncbi:glycoside hydrolase [Aureibaculum algae]|uniref:Glycoside hydrolase n=1 Tax=Aureibaculum algae TaxID=2584122 RepID=A0A5B7TQ95_9FLAO|nr:glycoside hydrolase family 43 protein [Aureibaculum algae]QCX37424.1 glycoside hydrolase [Aureibaculum algae]
MIFRNIYLQTLILLWILQVTLYSCKSEEKKEVKVRSETYSNPLEVQFGDPYVLDNGNGIYYMYGTGGGAKDGFSVYSSNNLIDWKYESQVYHGNTENSWNVGHFWAPEVYKINNKFYLFFSADWRNNPTKELENFRIGVAISDNPTGPFRDLTGEPLFDPGYPIIDANVFKDEDGQNYLFYSRVCYKHTVTSEIADWAKKEGLYDTIEESWVYGVKLKSDFKGIIGDPVVLLRPSEKINSKNAEWESKSVTSNEINRRWTEGSFTFKYKGIYYIMYSSNYYLGPNYAVGYATGSSPLGPFRKADNNPVLEKNTSSGGEVTGTGHNMVFSLNGGDNMYTVYHGRTKKSGLNRVVFLDELKILDDGKLIINGPTTDTTSIVWD